MSTVIKVENLCKRYYLSHRNRERFPTLRDAITRTASNMGKRLLHPLRASSGLPLEGLDSTEEFWALDDVSFEVKQGDRVGIIGRNGAGKSTLLKILSRITEPTNGRVSLKGRVASLLEVGTGFHPELTGRENIFLNGAILGMSRVDISRKFDEIVAFSEVEKFLDTPVKRYSSGMYVRLAFAVAAHLEPEILIVDEVLAVGDAQFQKKCLGKMEDVGKEGRTVLFVSHNLMAIRTLCTRALLLDKGSLVLEGAPEEIVRKYSMTLKETSTAREWSNSTIAPQNHTIVLKKAFVSIDGKSLDKIYTDTEFDVVVEYDVKREGGHVGLTFLFADEGNNLVFSSINNHEVSWYAKPMQKGPYRSSCKIPANLLNDGCLKVQLIIFGKNFSDGKTVDDFLTLEILDGPTVRGDFYGVCGGVIRPLLSWKTDRL